MSKRRPSTMHGVWGIKKPKSHPKDHFNSEDVARLRKEWADEEAAAEAAEAAARAAVVASAETTTVPKAVDFGGQTDSQASGPIEKSKVTGPTRPFAVSQQAVALETSKSNAADSCGDDRQDMAPNTAKSAQTDDAPAISYDTPLPGSLEEPLVVNDMSSSGLQADGSAGAAALEVQSADDLQLSDSDSDSPVPLPRTTMHRLLDHVVLDEEIPWLGELHAPEESTLGPRGGQKRQNVRGRQRRQKADSLASPERD